MSFIDKAKEKADDLKEKLPDSVICYTDSTIALPLITAYALARREARPLKRLYDRREADYEALRAAYRRRGSAGGVPTGMASRKKGTKAEAPHAPPPDADHLDRSR